LASTINVIQGIRPIGTDIGVAKTVAAIPQQSNKKSGRHPRKMATVGFLLADGICAINVGLRE
jgi:hypothetical protein